MYLYEVSFVIMKNVKGIIQGSFYYDFKGKVQRQIRIQMQLGRIYIFKGVEFLQQSYCEDFRKEGLFEMFKVCQ